MRNSRSGQLLLAAALLLALAAVPACRLDVHCPDVKPQAWWGDVDSAGMTFTGYGGKTVEGTIWRPHDTVAYPGTRPTLIDLHGYGEDECYQWWSAWALAGHGYVVLTITEPDASLAPIETKDAADWLTTSANPMRAQVDMTRFGLIGHSAGAEAAQAEQATDPRVRAFVALDNLRTTSYGCPDEIGSTDGQGATVLTPRAPGLGIARDSDCTLHYEVGDSEFPTPGYEAHRAADVPTGVLTIKGSQHLDYETNGSDVVHQQAFYAAKAWLDYWVANDVTGMDRILATSWDGVDRSTILSPYYRSGVDIGKYLCVDLRTGCDEATAAANGAARTAGAAADPAVRPNAAPSGVPPILLGQPEVLHAPGASPADDTAWVTGT